MENVSKRTTQNHIDSIEEIKSRYINAHPHLGLKQKELYEKMEKMERYYDKYEHLKKELEEAEIDNWKFRVCYALAICALYGGKTQEHFDQSIGRYIEEVKLLLKEYKGLTKIEYTAL